MEEPPLRSISPYYFSEAFLELLKSGADPNLKDQEGQSPLHHLVEVYTYQNKPIVTEMLIALVKAGARLNDKNLKGQTPLEIALRTASEYDQPKNNLALVKALLQLGTDPHVSNRLSGSVRDLLDFAQDEIRRSETYREILINTVVIHSF